MKKFVAIISLLLVITTATVLLTACAPSSVDKAKEKLEKADYTVVGYQSSNNDKDAGVIGGIIAMKGLLGSKGYVTALLFDSASSAKEAFENYKKNAGKNDEVKLTGKWIAWGDEQGIKDFTKIF